MTSSSRQSLPKVAKVEFDWKMKIALSTSAAFGCSFGEATLKELALTAGLVCTCDPNNRKT